MLKRDSCGAQYTYIMLPQQLSAIHKCNIAVPAVAAR